MKVFRYLGNFRKMFWPHDTVQRSCRGNVVASMFAVPAAAKLKCELPHWYVTGKVY